MHKEYLCNY